MKPFNRGSLWDCVTRASENALAAGVLLPLSTGIDYIEDAGVQFPVRHILAVKQRRASTADAADSPFLTRASALRVADVSETHVCLLNKFPVFQHHLLIVTREFEDQDSPLNIDDFQALWKCMAEYQCLGFYNGGTLAGASQRHKHLQIVPLPLAPRGPGIPIEPLLDLATLTGDMGRSALLPFPHVVATLPPDLERSDSRAANLTLMLYRSMLGEIGLIPEATPLGAYNLLVSRKWMFLAPRSQEKFTSISLNALAFAGHFLVRNEAEMNALREQGPISTLKHVASG